MALALGEDRDEHIGARHFFAPGRLHMDHRSLDDALEARRRLGILIIARHQVAEFIVDVIGDRLAQCVEIDVARAHHSRRIRVVDQCQQEVLQGRIFVMALIGAASGPGAGPFQGLLKMLARQFLISFP